MEDYQTPNPDEPLAIVVALVERLSEQIDMFYDPEDYHTLDSDFAAILPAIAMLQRHGIEPPAVVTHVMRRYLEQRRAHG